MPFEGTVLDSTHPNILSLFAIRRGGWDMNVWGRDDGGETEVECGPDFLRLASALSVPYFKDREEKVLLDAMLFVVPR